MQILIVEDNPTSRQLLVQLLGPFGTCQAVGDGPAAVKAFQDALTAGEGFDLICLDVMMPHMDGHEVLAAIHDLQNKHGCDDATRCKVVMTTAVDSPSSVERAQQSGADGYMVKPIRRAPLYQELQRLGLSDSYSLP